MLVTKKEKFVIDRLVDSIAGIIAAKLCYNMIQPLTVIATTQNIFITFAYLYIIHIGIFCLWCKVIRLVNKHIKLKEEENDNE